jgi:ABC-2 type transport system permease protein
LFVSRNGKKMKPYRVSAIVIRHLHEVRRNTNHIINMVYFPVMNLLVWGFFTIYLAHSDHQPGLVRSLLGAVILWGLFTAFQRDIAQGFLDELWSRNMVNLLASPLSVSEYVAGLILVNLIKVAVVISAESLVAWLFYHFNIFPLLIAFVPFILNLMLFALAVGVVITGLIFRYTIKVQSLAWSFASLLLPLSCVFYPLQSLPGFLHPVAWILPTTHSFEGMRQVIVGQGFSAAHFHWGLALNLAYLLFAALFFRWMFALTRSRGLLINAR